MGEEQFGEQWAKGEEQWGSPTLDGSRTPNWLEQTSEVLKTSEVSGWGL
jgi:hypothetical protein